MKNTRAAGTIDASIRAASTSTASARAAFMDNIRYLMVVLVVVYLVHFFIVVALQAALLRWIGGIVPVKIAIVFVAALTLSFAFSRWVLARHSRAFAIAILALFVFCLAARP